MIKERVDNLMEMISLKLITKLGRKFQKNSDGIFIQSYNDMKVWHKINFIEKCCKGKNVAHFGFVDSPFTAESVSSDLYLHNRIKKVCNTLVGIDYDEKCVKSYTEATGDTDVYVADIYNIEKIRTELEAYDTFVLGDILEHLDKPGLAIESIKSVLPKNAELIISVPNAFSLRAFSSALSNVELVHPDHISWYSPNTLKSLISRYDMEVKELAFYIPGYGDSISRRYILFPFLSDGILAVIK